MLAWPESAKAASIDLEEDDFYSPRARDAFRMLRDQFSRNSECDEGQLRIDLIKLLWEPATVREYIYRITKQILGVGGPSSIDGYCTHLVELRKRRNALVAAGLLSSGHSLEEMAEDISKLTSNGTAPATGCYKSLCAEVEDEISGARKNIEFDVWPKLSTIQALLPGTVTVLCGSPGVSKSFFALEATWRWHSANVPVAALELECGPNFHLRRAIAQMSGKSEVTRARWCKENPEKVRDILEIYRELAGGLRKVIHSPTDADCPNLRYLLGWMRRECSHGARLLVIDPITIMQSSDRYGKDHERFVYEAKNIVKRFGASLIVVTHPKRGMAGQKIIPCLENLPNSAAYERFSDTILWLEYVEEGEELFTALAPVNSEKKIFNRVLHCLKVRLSGNPRKIGYYFDPSNLRHVECGTFA